MKRPFMGLGVHPIRRGGKFTLKSIGGCKLWLRSDIGITVSGTSESLLTHSETLSNTTSWQIIETTTVADGAWTKITDTAVSGLHLIATQGPSPSPPQGTRLLWDIDVAEGTTKRIAIAVNGGAMYADFNLATGTVVAVSAGLTIVSVTSIAGVGTGKGWRVRLSWAHDYTSNVRLYNLTNTGAIQYAGTGQFYYANRGWVRKDPNASYAVTTTAPVIPSVTAWKDQSDNLFDFAQVTATRQPAYHPVDEMWGGKPSITFDGANDCLKQIGTASNAWNFMHDGTGCTVIMVGRFTGAASSEGAILGTYSGGPATEEHAQFYHQAAHSRANVFIGAGGVGWATTAQAPVNSHPRNTKLITRYEHGIGRDPDLAFGSNGVVSGAINYGVTPPATSTITRLLEVGARGDSAFAYAAFTAVEIIAYNKILTASDLTNIKNDINVRYSQAFAGA